MVSRDGTTGVLLLALLTGCSERGSTTAPAPRPTATDTLVPTATAAPTATAPPLGPACDAAVGRTLKSLARPLRVRIFAGPMVGRLATAKAAAEVFLARFAAAAPDMVTTEIVTVDSDAKRQQARELGIVEEPRDVGGETIPGTLGLVLDYGEAREVIPALTTPSLAVLPSWLLTKTRALRARVDGDRTHVGVVSSEGGVSLDEALTSSATRGQVARLGALLEQTAPSYQLVEVDPEAPIDPALAGLLLLQPGKDLSDAALDAIDTFVVGGGALAVFAGAVELPAHAPEMTAGLDRHRLDELLKGYGIELRSDLVVGPKGGVEVLMPTREGSKLVRAPGILSLSPERQQGSFDARFTGFFGMRELTLPYASSLVLHRERQPDAELRPLAFSPRSARALSGGPFTVRPGGPPLGPGAKGERRILAAVLDGEIRSARGEGRGASRVLVVASGLFLANPFARAGNPPPRPPALMSPGVEGDAVLQAIADRYGQAHVTASVVVATNTLDWMARRDELVACTSLLARGVSAKAQAEARRAARPKPKCTKAQIIALLDRGLSLDDAIEVCAHPRTP